MSTLADKFELDQKRRGLSPNTIILRKRQIASYEADCGPLEKATENSIQEWLDNRVKHDGDPISDKTRSGYLTTFSAFFKWGVKKDLIAFDPVSKIDRPKVQNGLPNPIPEHDLARAIQMCTNPMLKCWIVIEAYAGLRCQEVAYLCHEDLRYDLRQIHVRHGKGGKQRWVPMSQKIEDTLRAYEFPTTSGRLWPYATPAGVSQRINRYYHSIGIKHTAHKNRHRFGTQLYRTSGESLLVVQNALGHSDPKTSAIYSKVDNESVTAAVDLIP
jgi:site-specific recombinase XerD